MARGLPADAWHELADQKDWEKGGQGARKFSALKRQLQNAKNKLQDAEDEAKSAKRKFQDAEDEAEREAQASGRRGRG